MPLLRNISLPPPTSLLLLLLPLLVVVGTTSGQRFYGCKYDADLCTESEYCVDDELVGRCQPVDAPFESSPSLDAQELGVLRAELDRLLQAGVSWRDPSAQCTMAYLMFSVRYQLRYDPLFCQSNHPENIWALVHLVQGHFAASESPAGAIQTVDDATADDQQQSDTPAVLVPVAMVDDDDDDDLPEDMNGQMLEQIIDQLLDNNNNNNNDTAPSTIGKRSDNRVTTADSYRLSMDEERVLSKLLTDVMDGDDPDLQGLSDAQLDKFISYVELMRQLLRENDNNQLGGLTSGSVSADKRQGQYEAFDYDALADDDADPWLLKKDIEKLGDLDLGLENTQHNIVKGQLDEDDIPAHTIHRLEGDRVYIRLDKDLTRDERGLTRLVNYLVDKIATPNNQTFTDFSVSQNELSFKVADNPDLDAFLAALVSGKPIPDKRAQQLVPASGVADLVYSRKQDLQKVSGGEIIETGVGAGMDHIRLHPNGDDMFVVPTLVVCGVIVTLLVSLLGVYVYRHRSVAKQTVRRLAADIEARPSKAYEELCRARMSSKSETGGGDEQVLAKKRPSSQDSPTQRLQSWSDEPVASTNMDISTGHVILAYLEEHLADKEKLDKEWSTLCLYQPDKTDTTIALLDENKPKNRNSAVVPYDAVRVHLRCLMDSDDSGYINASPITDSDPHTPTYVAAQGPLAHTIADFWQMIWEQGCVVIVNLTKLNENGDVKCHRYWPENGSEIHGAFEVHLVSEHIWCEDYLVRSFYLKNSRTNETRTVTQFHYLSWPSGGVPTSPKSLLEFRRKVNKSYRGKSSPIIVHSSDGAGRTGTYCLLDMVLNRIAKGIKEINIAASLEYLRDQRMQLVATKEQYEFVLNCVAIEVQAIVKTLSH